MILIEMFRGTMGLSTRIFINPKGGGGAQTKENFEFLQLRTLGGYIKFFSPNTYFDDYNFYKIKKKNFLKFGSFSNT